MVEHGLEWDASDIPVLSALATGRRLSPMLN